MGYPTVTYREQFGKIGQLLIDELDQLVAQIQGFLSKEHKSTGAHSDITADSITVTGNVDIAGTTSIGENLTVVSTDLPTYGAFTLGSFPTSYLGLEWPQDGAGFFAFQLAAKGGTPPDAAVFSVGHQLATNVDVLKVRTGIAGVGNGWYLIPDLITSAGQGGVFLGDPLTSETFTNIYSVDVTASAGVTAGAAISAGTTVTAGTDVVATGVLYERGRAAAVGEWTAYTPTWSAGGTPPSLGNGTIAGKYMRVGKTTFFSIHLTTGSTTTYGTSTYTFSLPDTALASSPALLCCCTLQIFDSSAASFVAPGTGIFASATTVSGITSTGAQMNPTTPITFATSDQIRITGFYEEA